MLHMEEEGRGVVGGNVRQKSEQTDRPTSVCVFLHQAVLSIAGKVFSSRKNRFNSISDCAYRTASGAETESFLI